MNYALVSDHLSRDFWEDPEDGWWRARCTCGFAQGPLPDSETACDVLMEHAYDAGRLAERRAVEPKPVKG